MLTVRAWWLLLTVFALLLFGMLASHPVLALTGLTILLWFAWEWILFAVRRHFLLPKLFLERTLYDGRGPVTTLWAGRVFRVETRLRLPSRFNLPFVLVTERVPFAADLVDGLTTGQGAVGGKQPIELAYRIRCDQVGVARFEGVRVQFADYQGYFYHAAFVPLVACYRVLPLLHDGRGLSAGTKQRNQLLPPGVHRLRTPGSGSELLDLRDYASGDPPKTIAWKISARRDRLITKVYENEVPIRCTLFVDASNSVRVPSARGTALRRLLEIATAVIRANTKMRDLTGLCLFDEQEARYAAPDRKGAHLNRLLQMLADAAALVPATSRADPEPLLPMTYRFAGEVYPKLLADGFNYVPFWLTWFSSFPRYTRRSRALHRLLASRMLWFAISCIPIVGGLCLFLIFKFTESRRRRQHWRKKLAALLSVRYGLAPGGLAALLEDDDAFSLLLQRFLAEHHVPFRLPLYDRDGPYLFAAPEKIPALAAALQRAIGRGRDNDLFVLLVDLLELDESLAALLGVVHVALSRHHQVILVCPWPTGLPLPRPEPAEAAIAAEHGCRDSQPQHSLPFPGSLPSRTPRLRPSRRAGRCAASDEAVPLILERINRLRTLRKTPR